jgi:deoxyribodipyrimidine photo-lyase
VIRCAHTECGEVFHAFVIDPSQHQLQDDSSKSSMKRLKFLSETLADLNTNLVKMGSKLHIYTGRSDLVIPDILTRLDTPKMYYHDEYIHEEKVLLSSTVSALGGRFPISSYWGGGTIYETKDLPFDLGMQTCTNVV